MVEVALHVDSVEYKEKPNVRDISKKGLGINARILRVTTKVTPQELAALFEKGHTVLLGVHKGARKKSNLVEQQVLALDFDNTEDRKVDGKKIKTSGKNYVSIKDMLENDFIQNNASFIYNTFSHQEDWEKFRVVFILDEPVKDTNEITYLYSKLMEQFPTADKSTKDSSRLFYGGTKSIEIGFDTVLNREYFGEYQEDLQSITGDILPKGSIFDVKLSEKYRGDKPTWLLIKEGEKELVANRLSELGGMKVYDQASAMEVLSHMNMKDILGIYHSPINDILSHDVKPSCGIWQTEKGTWLYTRQGKVGNNGGNISKNIVQVVAELLGKNGKPANIMQTIGYLTDVIGIEVERTEKLREIKSEAEVFKQLLLSSDFKETYPSVYQIFGRYKYQSVVNTILDVFLFNIYEDKDTQELRCLSWLSEKNLADRVGVSHTKMSKMLNLMTLVGALNKLDNSKIPANLLHQLESNKKHFKKGTGEYVERVTERARRSSVYEVPKLIQDFSDITEKCEQLVDRGFTTKALSKEYVARTFGEAEANRVYPQDKDRKVNKLSKTITTDIHRITMQKIDKDGYAIVNEVKEEVQRKWKSKGFTEYKYQQALGEMLDTYDLTKKSLTNSLRKEFGITHLSPTARPAILIANKH